MTWLIIAFVLTLMVAALTWIMPSPSERRRMRLRDRAIRQGFRVRELDGDLLERARAEGGEGRWFLYHYPWPRAWGEKERQRFKGWVRLNETIAPDSPLFGLLDSMPHRSLFHAFYGNSQGFGLVWREEGGEQPLEEALVALRRGVETLR